MTRAVTVQEPEWTGDERGYLLASRRLERRGAHGHLLTEATSPEANPANAEGAYYYRTGTPIVDWAEHARAKAHEDFRKNQSEGESMAGYMFPVIRVDRSSSRE